MSGDFSFEVVHVRAVLAAVETDRPETIGLCDMQHGEIRRILHQNDVALVGHRLEHEVDPLLSAADDERVVRIVPLNAHVLHVIEKSPAERHISLGRPVLQHADGVFRQKFVGKFPYLRRRKAFRRGHAARKGYHFLIAENFENFPDGVAR